MRSALFLLALIALSCPAQADEFSVQIRSERPFGHFVGDLVRAHVDVHGSEDATLISASLPHPGPLTVSLDLRDVSTEEIKEKGAKFWRIHLTYQNFYVALDVRNIEVPGFMLSFSRPGGDVAANVPGWRFGVAPLREIAPEPKERGADYLRPDPVADFVDKSRLLATLIICAATTIFFVLAVARDRAWPPFHKRRARIFSILARQLAAEARRPCSEEKLRLAMRKLHRAIDAACGHSILKGDLAEFFRGRPEFASSRASAERFFAVSDEVFFNGASDASSKDFSMAELVRFAEELAEREKTK
jgi:mxaA protein